MKAQLLCENSELIDECRRETNNSVQQHEIQQLIWKYVASYDDFTEFLSSQNGINLTDDEDDIDEETKQIEEIMNSYVTLFSYFIM